MDIEVARSQVLPKLSEYVQVKLLQKTLHLIIELRSGAEVTKVLSTAVNTFKLLDKPPVFMREERGHGYTLTKTSNTSI